ncbi:hypothetical protein SISNIDRAFT_283618 [Sistotremastrum niveocremeum HHB9708]|uniref:Uncharacterized protein n=2 Tax=Sistotremastraceae TaxID=3402574 RepID=A0A164Y8U9_9AGAM|nr:hypothetical protein SISNIDRAFT_283618 [Sistotremastrum niveocremeum HHB9708]KZT42385.1 hypothetical protein SISSUDRAFT_1058736 [Sistotremastrum suecicum HHB10207 ss-3]
MSDYGDPETQEAMHFHEHGLNADLIRADPVRKDNRDIAVDKKKVKNAARRREQVMPTYRCRCSWCMRAYRHPEKAWNDRMRDAEWDAVHESEGTHYSVTEDEVWEECACLMGASHACLHTREKAEVRLEDVMRPAKPRGTKKDFEFLSPMKRVLVIDDDEEVGWGMASSGAKAVEADDWEYVESFNDTDGPRERSYASVVNR